MALTGVVSLAANLPGARVRMNFALAASGSIEQKATLDAALAGTLSTRTSDTAGTLTMGANHGITDADIIAIFWTGGAAYLATVGTVDGLSVPFTGAAGDVLPVGEAPAVTVQIMTPLDVDFDGDKAECVAVSFSRRGVIVFEDSGDAVLDAADIAAGEGYAYVEGLSQSNPLTGNAVDEVWIANGDSTATNAFVLGVLYNSDE